MKDLIERFWSKVKVGPGCWEWQASKSKGGYGWFGWRNKLHTAHRIAWMLVSGHLPRGQECVCHSCDNPACVRPTHLFLGTQLENIQDAKQKDRFRKFSPGPAKMLRKKGLTYRQIASKIGSSSETAWRLVNGNS